MPLLGKRSADALSASLGLDTVGDLLRHYPRRYMERGDLTSIAGLEIGEHVTVMAEIRRVNSVRMKTRRGTRTEVEITDGQRVLTLALFNQQGKYKDKLVVGARGLFAGKVGMFNRKLQLANPDIELFDDETDSVDDVMRKMVPVYPAAQKLPTWQIANCVKQVLTMWDGADDPLPTALRKQLDLLGLEPALRAIHMPDGW
ncbi:ATP-dependent DNA helicase RecG, partial [Kibdelosporangium lantanae]